MKYQLDQVHLLGRVVISKTAPSYMTLYLKPISAGGVLLSFHTACAGSRLNLNISQCLVGVGKRQLMPIRDDQL